MDVMGEDDYRDIWEAEKAVFVALTKLSGAYYAKDIVGAAMVALHMAQHVAAGLDPVDDEDELPAADFSGKTDKN
jgi:hypothetical protein